VRRDGAVDIKQLRYFLAIAEEGQISRASRRLHIAQPPLSQQLKLLEIELNVQLVERGSRKIELTEAGEALRNRAEQILRLIDTTVKELKQLNDGLAGTLSIGTVASSGTTLLPERILKFHQQYPGIRFQLWEGDTNKVLDLLNNGVIEIGIVHATSDAERYESICLPNDRMVAAMSEKWDQGRPEQLLPLAALADKPILCHRRSETRITECCRQAGFEPNILCEGDDVRALLVLADAGVGVALVSRTATSLVPGKNLKYREICDPVIEISRAVVWLRKHQLSAAAKHFLKEFSG
jgi:DNA-binding transcriptional LysR family regulator